MLTTVYVCTEMILSYRKRATSPECPIIRNPANNDQLPRVEEVRVEIGRSQIPAQPQQQAEGSPAKNRKNKPFASFFQKFRASSSSSANNEIGAPSSEPPTPSNSKAIKCSNSEENVDQTSQAPAPSKSDTRRDSSYHNEAYAFSSPSSCSTSAESINTVMSTNSFAFVPPKTYGGKKKHGKRIPLDQDDDIKAEPTPVKLKVQQAQPLPNSRRKKLSTLSRLSMKIGLKSKYNLQSCESLQHAPGSLRREGAASHDSGSASRGRGSSKRRAPLPPSGHGHGHSHVFHIPIPPGPSTTSSVHNHESVQLKSVVNIGSNERLPPPGPPRTRIGAISAQQTINSNAGPSHMPCLPTGAAARWTPSVQQLQHQHRRYHSDGYGYGNRPSARVYHHVRGKRRAPVPPARLVTVAKISGEGETQPAPPHVASTRSTQAVASCQEPWPNTNKSRIQIQSSVNQLYPQLNISEEERIIQNILNVKPDAADDRTVTNGNHSTTSGADSTSTCRLPSSSSSYLQNNNTSAHVHPNMAQRQSTQLANANSVSASAIYAQHDSSSQMQRQKQTTRKAQPITATLGCYESFEEDDDDGQDHLSTNSLLVHEKQLNEKVKSHLGKSCAQNSVSNNANSARMPFFFNFKKNTAATDKENGRSQYANGLAIAPQQSSSSQEAQNLEAGTSASASSSSSPTPTQEVTTPPVKMTPRPWYKRSNSKDKSNTSPGSSTTPGGGAPNKNKPSISILTNISELDRQAGEIVEEKKRRSAIEQNESAKKLISMFNTAFSGQSKDKSPTEHVVTLPGSAGPSSPSPLSSPAIGASSTDERKKLAIVQPQQANTNFQQQNKSRPFSTPSSASIFGSSSPLSRARTGTNGVLQGIGLPVEQNRAPVSTSEDWACPRCTLQNAHWRSFCDACHFRQGSTVVHSIASIFEATAAPQERRSSIETVTGLANNSERRPSTTSTQVIAQSSVVATLASSITTTTTQATATTTTTARVSTLSTMNPPTENLLSHTSEKSDKDKKLDGIKLHADDPEIEELDLEKLREARLAFFARHKSEKGGANVSPRSSSTSENDNTKSKFSLAVQAQSCSKLTNSNNLNQFRTGITNGQETCENENQYESDNTDFEAARQLHQELNPNAVKGPQKWQPLNSPKLENGRAAKGSTAPNNHDYELDPTYENWHLKLSELDIDDDDGIRDISTEIKDQLNYFDRLKSKLREQRSPANGLDEEGDYSNSESDASTVIDVASFGAVMEDRDRRRRSQQESLRFIYGGESSRRRISMGDPTPVPRPFIPDVQRHRQAPGSSRPYYGSFERDHGNYESRHRSHSQQPEFDAPGHRTRLQEEEPRELETRQKNRALEHSASAISKQLRKLEWAINVGDHKLAASLAHDLAILKANCKKVSEVKAPQPITIRVYVEDRVMQQGPFQVPVTMSTTVKELKRKIESDWGIPLLFQKWILGRKIAEDDEQSLAAYEVVNDSMAFLYLVTPNNGKQQSSSGSEESVQIMAHLAKSPPVSRKVVPDEVLNTAKEIEIQECKSAKPVAVAGPSSAGKPANEAKISPMLISKHGQQVAPTKNSPVQPHETVKTEPSAKSVTVQVQKGNGTKLSPQRKGSAGSTETAAIEIPKSTKTVSSKYIESIKQTSLEEPASSPENAILKQNVHGDKVGKKKIEPNPEAKSTPNVDAATKAQPSSPKLLNRETIQLRDGPLSAKQDVKAAIKVERLLETSTELSQKAHKQPVPHRAALKKLNPENWKPDSPETVDNRNHNVGHKTESEGKHANSSTNPLLTKPVQPAKLETNGAVTPDSVKLTDANLASNAKSVAGSSKASLPVIAQLGPKIPASTAKTTQNVPPMEKTTDDPAFKSKSIEIEIRANLPPSGRVSGPHPLPGDTPEGKSKNRWNSNTKPEEPIKNDTDRQILHRRKDSDAIDINLQVEVSSEQLGASSSTSAAKSPAAARGKTCEKKEDNTETYRKMLQLMENEDCVRNTEELDCPVCFNKVPAGAGVTLRDCLHSFCRECLAGTIKYSDEPQVKCPFRDNKYSCESFLQEREIKGLVSPAMFEKHLAQAVKLAENKIANTFHCKTNDCTGWCIFEDDVNVFKCPVCRKSNCLTCQAIHEGKNCQEYQRELAINAETDEGAKSSRIMLEKMIQRGEALECPACHVVLLKKWGCDWVRCSYCKTEICWVTKSHRWGPGGKGDTSGGCKCGVNGVKCHPKCTYCH